MQFTFEAVGQMSKYAGLNSWSVKQPATDTPILPVHAAAAAGRSVECEAGQKETLKGKQTEKSIEGVRSQRDWPSSLRLWNSNQIGYKYH